MIVPLTHVVSCVDREYGKFAANARFFIATNVRFVVAPVELVLGAGQPQLLRDGQAKLVTLTNACGII
jgi:hypothetical protein